MLGKIPRWYRVYRAARNQNVPLWEMFERGVGWLDLIEACMRIENTPPPTKVDLPKAIPNA